MSRGPAGGHPTAGPGSEIRRPEAERDRRRELAEDVLRGLTSSPKQLSPKWLYDDRGSRLFERITRLPEYYQTRTERAILERIAPSLVHDLRPTALVELGAGNAEKTRVLLNAMEEADLLRAFAPIDVSADALEAAVERLSAEYPEVRVVGVVADFEGRLSLPLAEERRLVVFLGSTIGNLEPEAGAAFLRRVGEQLRTGEGFLLGLDLVKDVARIEAAYNDVPGVTARFNRNVLRVLNRELDADFDLDAFRHLAFYDRERARVEMHLVSERTQEVRIGALDLELRFAPEESIRTELSHKYTRDSAGELLGKAGLRLARWEEDAEGLFALALARPG